MNILDFAKACPRTLNDCKDLLTHMEFGIFGEIGEVVDLKKKEFFHGHAKNNDKLMEELGDVLFYCVNLLTLTDPLFLEKFEKEFPLVESIDELSNELVFESDYDKYLMLVLASSEILNTNEEKELAMLIYSLILAIGVVMRSEGLDIEDCFQANVDKLLKRYPNGFETEKSVNRTV